MTTVVRRATSRVALVAAPLLLAVGSALEPDERQTGPEQLDVIASNATRFGLAHLLVVFGAILFVPAIGELLRFLDGRGAWLGLGGAALAVVGAVFTGMHHGVLAIAPSALASLDGAERERAATGMQAIADLHGLTPLALAGALLLPFGLMLLGAALLRGRALPVWAGTTLVASAFLSAVGIFHCRLPVLLGLEQTLVQEDECVPPFLPFGDIHWVRAFAAVVLTVPLALLARRLTARGEIEPPRAGTTSAT